jgi:hypothetical protein
MLPKKDGPELDYLDKVVAEKIAWNEELMGTWREEVAAENAGETPGPSIPIRSSLPKCMANTIREAIRTGMSMPTVASLEKLVLLGEKTAEERNALGIQPKHVKDLMDAGLVSEGPFRRCTKLEKDNRPTVRAEPTQLLGNGKRAFSSNLLTWRDARKFLLKISERKKKLSESDRPNEGGPKMGLICRWMATSLSGRETQAGQTPVQSDLDGAIKDLREFFGDEEIPPEVATVIRWLKMRSEDHHLPGRRIVFWPEDPPQPGKKNEQQASGNGARQSR